MRLTVFGGTTDTEAVARAAEDAEAVISLLGPPSKPGLGRVDVAPLLDGYRNIVAAMQTHRVRRLVALGTPSPPTAGNLPSPYWSRSASGSSPPHTGPWSASARSCALRTWTERSSVCLSSPTARAPSGSCAH
jgi:nucleoside-diphosphate-sugar epimerase